MGNFGKAVRKVKPLVQLNLFEPPPVLQPITVDRVHYGNNLYDKREGKFYQLINKNSYEVVDAFVIAELQKIWLSQNATGATLFTDGEPNHQL